MAVHLKSGVDGHLKQLRSCLKQGNLLKTISTAIRNIPQMMENNEQMAGLGNRKLYVMRHAERVDFTFGDWIPSSFDKDGAYIRRDMNMPSSVLVRPGGPWDFFKDCPLTNIGLYQATLTGLAMKDSGVKFSHVFCSPSLRCIETCTNALKASDQSHLVINVEPGLFEWLSWYNSGMPVWLSLDALKAAGFNVSLTYQSIVSTRDLTNTSETIPDYYMRSYLLTQEILKKYTDGNILFVGHAATLDTCTRQLVGLGPRNFPQFQNIVSKTPYASIITVVEDTDSKWRLQPPPFPSASVMHSNNIHFDWNMLNS